MKTVVCVKQVRTLGDEVEFTSDERDVDPDYVELAVNEWDTYAVEEALRVKEATGEGEVVVVTVGGEDAEEALRRCLAMGADRAIRVDERGGRRRGPSHHRPPAGSRGRTGVSRPRLRRRAVERLGAGRHRLDARRPPRTPTGGGRDQARVRPRRQARHRERELEGGLIDVVEVDTPALLTIQTGINEPRYATLRAIKQANQQEIAVLEAVSEGEPAYRVRRMFVPPRGEGAEPLGDTPAVVASRIAEIVKARLS